jgi:hypothetical protein
MANDYELPMTVGIALTTERIQFLAGVTDEQLIEHREAFIKLLGDLIDDRRKLRHQVNRLSVQLKSMSGQVAAVANAGQRLLNTLDGTEYPEDEA